MKTSLKIILLAGTLVTLFIFFSGCYTQIGAMRDEREEGEEYTASHQDNDSTYTRGDEGEEYQDQSIYEDGGYGWRSHPHVGYSYYYPNIWPSYAFSVAYANPWCYGSSWAYDPWLCGTPYVRYPVYGGYYPSYDYVNPYYYSPSFSYYPGYAHGYRAARQGTRDFGTTRGSTGNRGTNSDYSIPNSGRGNSNLPAGASYDGRANGSAPNKNAPLIKDNSRAVGSQRAPIPRNDGRSTVRTDRSVRGSGSRAGNTRGYVPGDKQPPQARLPESKAQPSAPVYRVPPRNTGEHRENNHGNRDAGSTRVIVPSAPPVHPPQSAPPPSHSAPPPASSGGRTGGSRGGRP